LFLSYLGNGIDFISDDIVATFNPGETSTSVVVPVVADDVNNEGTEFFALGLRLPNISMDSGLIVNLGSNRIATASILDAGKQYHSALYHPLDSFLDTSLTDLLHLIVWRYKHIDTDRFLYSCII